MAGLKKAAWALCYISVDGEEASLGILQTVKMRGMQIPPEKIAHK